MIDYGVQQYIAQHYPHHYWSEPIYEQSANNGTINGVHVDYTDRGAKAIVCFYLKWANPDNAFTIINFFDNTNKIITTASKNQETELFNFSFVFDSGQLHITCDLLTLAFSVGHQYLTIKSQA